MARFFGMRKPTLNSQAIHIWLRCAVLGLLFVAGTVYLHHSSPATVHRAYDYVTKASQYAQARPIGHGHDGDHRSNTPPSTPSQKTQWTAAGAVFDAAGHINRTHMADYLNYLVDRFQLSNDVAWYARRVQPSFAGQGWRDDGLDDDEPCENSKQSGSRLSLTRSRDYLLHGQGFVSVHAPGRRALADEAARQTRIQKDTAELSAELATKTRPHGSPWSIPSPLSQRPTAVPVAVVPPPVDEKPLRLRMARSRTPDAVNASMLVVGTSSTFARLRVDDFALVDDWALWLTDGHGNSNGAMLVLNLHKPRLGEPAIVRRLLQERGIDFYLQIDQGSPWELENGGDDDDKTDKFHPPTGEPITPDAAIVQYAKLLPLMRDVCLKRGLVDDDGRALRNGTAPRKLFYALVEDDIFFPSMGKLLGKLRALHREAETSDEVAMGLAAMAAAAANATTATATTVATKTRPSATTTTSTTETTPTSRSLSQAVDNLYVGFPSDPRSDWLFVNESVLPEDLMGLSHGGSAVFLSPPLAHLIAASPCLAHTAFLASAQTPLDAVLAAAAAAASSTASTMTTTPTTSATGAEFTPIGPIEVFPPPIPQFDSITAAAEARGGIGVPWDAYLYQCVVQLAPDAHLRLVPSFYAPSDAALYTSYRDHHDRRADAAHIARLHQYRGGTQPLALHNARAWHAFAVGAGHRVTAVCGEACFLQRFYLADRWVLVNGHSLEHYPDRKAVPRPVSMHRIGSTDIRNTGRHGLPPAGNAIGCSSSSSSADTGLPPQLATVPDPSRRDRGDLGYHDDSSGHHRGFFATFLDRLVAGDSDNAENARAADAAAAAHYASARERRYAAQQDFWFFHHVAIEEPERPDDLQILEPHGGHDGLGAGTRQTWFLLDAQITADGAVLQAYVRRRQTGGGARRTGPLGAGSGPGKAETDERRLALLDVGGYDPQTLAEEETSLAAEDSVILLIWEKPKDV